MSRENAKEYMRVVVKVRRGALSSRTNRRGERHRTAAFFAVRACLPVFARHVQFYNLTRAEKYLVIEC